MTIHTRLVMGHTILALLVALTAASAALGFHDISVTVRERLDRYLQSWELSEDLVQAIDVQQEAALEIAFERTPAAEVAYDNARTDLRAALAALARSSHADDSPGATRDVQRHVAAYQATADGLFETDVHPTTERVLRGLTPVFRDARGAAQRLVAESHELLRESREGVENDARRRSALLGALATVGLLALVVFTRALNVTVLERLSRISGFAHAIEQGHDDARLVLEGDDELARLANEMNRILDQHDAVERRRKGELRVGRELLIGLTAACGDRAVLLGPRADLVVYVGALPSREWLDAFAMHLREQDSAAPNAESLWAGPEETHARVRSLHRFERHVGWLAVIE